ncbi:MAG: IMP cyclohydrolase [Desulfovibrio sp.]|jgi:phosphoribosylaminoimidazolecarboxamide formyltransferase/IMP cyclohydrolase|nr:IMP cyclohydrolase [Desulfovibrio sp.]
MSKVQEMYKTIAADDFPDTIALEFGDSRISYRRRSWNIGGEQRGLRYGENPDQPAALYEAVEGYPSIDGVRCKGPGQGLVSSLKEEQMLQAGKHPGKTNLTDVDNGINILQYLHARPAALIIKHNNPCGAAWSGAGIADALSKAYWSDRIAAFGGTVVVNRPLNLAAADLISSSYYEVVAAPDFEQGVLAIIKKRKNLRILRIPGLAGLEQFSSIPFLDIKSLCDGGLVLQRGFSDRIRSVQDFLPARAEKDGKVIEARTPTPAETEDLLFAWAVESGVSSNSVIFAKDGATVGIGTGEQDRVGCVELTIHKACTKYKDMLVFRECGKSLYEVRKDAAVNDRSAALLADAEAAAAAARGGLKASVLVSDGFFPFRDGVDLALEQGVTAIAQPGGSLRDGEVIAAVNEASPPVAMVFTGQRSFRH